MDMTTGLQSVTGPLKTRFRTRAATALRIVATRFPSSSPRRRSRSPAVAMPATRPAREIKRGAGAVHGTGVCDAHDAAILHGVFPPRL